MKRKNQMPFSIEAWKNGAKVETRDGRQVRILCTDAKASEGCIVGLVINSNSEYLGVWHDNGRYWVTDKVDYRDLVIVAEIEEPERWADDKNAEGEGYFIGNDSYVKWDKGSLNNEINFKLFASKNLAKSALAMARISQLMAHDERYGGAITDEEWTIYNRKYVIERWNGRIEMNEYRFNYTFLAFHTPEQRNLFLKENEQLVRNYLMID